CAKADTATPYYSLDSW
nr:immunoglobulin heavy chain junction region [Macaca mulatta]MOV53753.1 immunoglobulin heavy chain junction region [Macaca mulatta]MOV53877.1 immunoglobulin heavy chain junction region [Macaca mulatta]MOV54197.1 immunoglobulin heavy chain junction region [Macaca mulatta]MOV54998.1 immunoglobulin heavy chain junction region [Macaca mulatta]